MENNQTIEALEAVIKSLKSEITEIKTLLTTLVKITEDREKRFAERGARPPHGDRGGDRGGFGRPRPDRDSNSNWGNRDNSGGFSPRGGRNDRDRNKG